MVIPDALVEQTVKDATVYDKFQFERIGFFSVDPDSNKRKVSCQPQHQNTKSSHGYPCIFLWC